MEKCWGPASGAGLLPGQAVAGGRAGRPGSVCLAVRYWTPLQVILLEGADPTPGVSLLGQADSQADSPPRQTAGSVPAWAILGFLVSAEQQGLDCAPGVFGHVSYPPPPRGGGRMGGWWWVRGKAGHKSTSLRLVSMTTSSGSTTSRWRISVRR